MSSFQQAFLLHFFFSLLTNLSEIIHFCFYSGSET